MRILGRLLIGLIVLVVLLAAGAYLLPREVTVARSVVIDAPVERVFPLVNSLKRMSEWSPWVRRDPAIQITYEGPDEGVGAKMAWTSGDPQVGTGTQEITLSAPNERVETALDFGPMGTPLAILTLAPEGAGTKVTWVLEVDMGMNPMSRWMGLMMDRWVGADYEAGLASLKTLAEMGAP